MAGRERLSLETVRWPTRLIAVGIGLFVATSTILPIGFLFRAGFVGMLYSVFLVPFYLPEALWLSLVYWSVPAFVIGYIALSLRLSFLGFLAAGAMVAVVGLLIAGIADASEFAAKQHRDSTIVEHIQWTVTTIRENAFPSILDRYPSQRPTEPRFLRSLARTFPSFSIVFALAGVLAGAVVWGVMAVGRLMYLDTMHHRSKG